MTMVLRLVTPASERVVSINEARRHLRVEDTDSDDLIAGYIEAAEQSLAYLGRALKPATYALDIYSHSKRHIDLPMPPLRSITSVSVAGSDGALSTLDPVNYTVITTSEGRGQIRLADGYSWPFFAHGSVMASIAFTAGYDIVPAALRAAILLIAGTLFDNRAAVAPISTYAIPGVENLISPFREQFV